MRLLHSHMAERERVGDFLYFLRGNLLKDQSCNISGYVLVWALRGKEIKKKTSAYCVINSTHKPLSLSLFSSVLFLFLSPYFGFSFLLLRTFTMCFFNSSFCMGNRLELIMTVG